MFFFLGLDSRKRYEKQVRTVLKIMSVRKNGIYTTAKWDFAGNKVHFLYDGFECDTKQLDSFKGFHLKI